MDLVRFGVIIRALRRRRGWRQSDLAIACEVSQSVVSDIERGHADRVALSVLIRLAAALEARVLLELRWRGGELERLLDADHAAVAAALVRRLGALGWDVRVEVTYATARVAGSIDVLAWHSGTGALLVVEVKTEIASAEATIRKLDEKTRLGAAIAAERFGWRASSISRLLVIEDRRTARRRVAAHGELFGIAFPMRAIALRRWLMAPQGTVAALVFLSPIAAGGRMSKSGGRHRVRRPVAQVRMVHPRSNRTEPGSPDDLRALRILTNRT